jgi:probable phosphoglycerate mutase
LIKWASEKGEDGLELFIIRHGESFGNRLATDLPDAELTDLGKEQAAHVGECMKHANVEVIIASPLTRAIETAQPLARAINLPIDIWKNTYEVRSRGPYTGPAVSRLQERYPEARFPDDMEPEGWFYPGDETSETGQMRAAQVYAELCGRCVGKRVALFAHGGFNRRLLLAALGLGHDSRVYFHQHNGCIYWLTVKPDRTVLNYLGDVRVI